MTYENILVETRDRVGIIRLNRPQRMNALNDALAKELSVALHAFDDDDGIGCIVHHRQRQGVRRGRGHRRDGGVGLRQGLRRRLHHARLGGRSSASASR